LKLGDTLITGAWNTDLPEFRSPTLADALEFWLGLYTNCQYAAKITAIAEMIATTIVGSNE
jgi:hypothetical protein